mmetsp:Transcript_16282/g.24534  ORF Transcript_16282/g.24534 Transcript_16282/m.24534 type:complete len:102 (+) Transcript_16282:105-410(+)
MRSINIESPEGTLLDKQRSRCCYCSKPKTTFAAVLFLIAGLSFIITGIVIALRRNGMNRGLSLICLGAVMFLPGSYVSYLLLGVGLGWQNFDSSMIPSYDE